MEYIFRNGPNGKPQKLLLNEYDIIVEQQGSALTIPYASITEVRLSRKRDLFAAQIFALNDKKISITNKSFQLNQWVDQSRAYHTFMRVLHMHLSSKSSAVFYSGSRIGEYTLKCLILFTITALLYVGEEYFDLIPMSSSLLAFVFGILGGVMVLSPLIHHWPKNYSPTDIPLDLLPPA